MKSRPFLLGAIIALGLACNTPTDPSPPLPDSALVGFTAGVPFGASQLLNADASKVPGTLKLAIAGVSPKSIDDAIAEARQRGIRLFINMTGGHTDYMSVINGVFQFDLGKWKERQRSFDTAYIRDLMAKAVADGVIIGASVMDEPHVSGLGDGNTWGPAGTMQKEEVDYMCGYVKAIFPTLPTGVFHRHDVFEPKKNYAKCDFIVSQYVNRAGDVRAFRDAGLAFAARSGISIAFSMNVINGGVQDRDGTWNCTGTGQYGRGTQEPRCRMTPTQVKDYGLVLGPAGCALNMWQWNDDYFTRSAVRDALAVVASKLSGLPRKACRRTA